MAIIPFNATNFKDIKDSINEFIEENRDRYPILDNYEGSVRTMLIDLLAGFAAYTNYKSVMYYNNSFIKTALSERAVLELALNRYGYNFNRAVSPKIKLKYSESNLYNKNIKSGDVVGNIKLESEYLDLVYFGESRELHPGDEFIVSVGKLNVIEGNFLNHNFDEKITIDLTSNSMNIDNNDISIFINDEKKDITKNPEYYIIENKILDISIYYNFVKLIIFEPLNKYGMEIEPIDRYKVYYLETFGRFQNLLNYVKDMELENEYYFVDIVSYGEDAETIEKIRHLAPLYYTTFRVMSNDISHRVISMAYPGVIDVYVEKNPKKCCNLDWYVLLEGSREVSREFSDYEKEKYIKYLDKYKFIGMTIEKENIKIPFVKKREWIIAVKYDCDKVKSDDNINVKIGDFVRNVVNRFTLKLGVKFTAGEIMSEISKYKYGLYSIINEVIIFEDFANYYSVIPSKIYSASPKEYYWIDLRVEVECGGNKQ